MFEEMRRRDKRLTDEEMLDIMSTAEYGLLSTFGENGYPYGVPVNYVFKDGNIYFHTALSGHKLDNVAFNSKVSFCVVKDVELIPEDINTKFKSVISFGEVKEVPENEKSEIYILFLKKFSKEFIKDGLEYIKNEGAKAKVLRIEVIHMTAKGKK